MSSLQSTFETILAVDDNESVRGVVVTILKDANFLVLSAESGRAAIQLAEQTQDPIHLLLSDVDMPDISGPSLGETLRESRPEMHVMLMSGQNEGSLLVLNYGWAFIRKPFLARKLVEMVNDVLHSANRSQLGGEGFDSRKDTAENRHKMSYSAPSGPGHGSGAQGSVLGVEGQSCGFTGICDPAGDARRLIWPVPSACGRPLKRGRGLHTRPCP
jgi:DNA-binding NtrC family response regulator